MKQLATVFGIGTLALSVTACSSSSPVSPSASSSSAQASTAAAGIVPAATARAGVAKPGPLTIVGIVVQDDGEFDVLQAAVIRAELVDALNGTTQYTVFAPTDQAFANAIGGGSEAAALAAVGTMDIDALTDILLFHVTNGRRISASVLGAPQYQMLNDKTLTRAQLSAAGIEKVDLPASNGIVHIINGVLIPSN